MEDLKQKPHKNACGATYIAPKTHVLWRCFKQNVLLQAIFYLNILSRIFLIILLQVLKEH
jgi:hypothetical protein